jgi:hypothetical protein
MSALFHITGKNAIIIEKQHRIRVKENIQEKRRE